MSKSSKPSTSNGKNSMEIMIDNNKQKVSKKRKSTNGVEEIEILPHSNPTNSKKDKGKSVQRYPESPEVVEIFSSTNSKKRPNRTINIRDEIQLININPERKVKPIIDLTEMPSFINNSNNHSNNNSNNSSNNYSNNSSNNMGISVVKKVKSPTKSNILPETIQPTKTISPKTNIKCAICLDLNENDLMSTSCGHLFCGNCIKQYKKTSRNVCPICRKPIKSLIKLYL